jgi:hypothetical protein
MEIERRECWMGRDALGDFCILGFGTAAFFLTGVRHCIFFTIIGCIYLLRSKGDIFGSKIRYMSYSEHSHSLMD